MPGTSDTIGKGLAWSLVGRTPWGVEAEPEYRTITPDLQYVT